MTNQDQCREAFEAWARKDGTWEVVRDDKEAAGITSYTDFNLALAWHTWQAARPATGMPAGWVPVPVEPTKAMRSVIINESDVYQSPDALYAALLAAAPKLPQGDVCWCQTCRPITLDDMRMVLCPECGNKRCPRARHHDNLCTGSNEPGQPGSSWAHGQPSEKDCS